MQIAHVNKIALSSFDEFLTDYQKRIWHEKGITYRRIT